MTTTSTVVRHLGAHERMFHQTMESNFPQHFCVAAEFPARLTEAQVTAALAAVQDRHPLLRVHIEDHPETRLGFYQPAIVPPINLRISVQEAGAWQEVVAEELSRPFDSTQSPLARAVLVQDGTYCVLVLVFYHSIVDGVGAMDVLEDVVAALNGHELEPTELPASQEEAIADKLPSLADLNPGQPPAEDPRMLPATPHIFDGTPPFTSTVTLDVDSTRRLVERCRSEGTTVHSLLVAVASRVRASLTGEDFLRVMTPFDLRGHIGGGGRCVDYHGAARTGSEPLNGDSLWVQARAVGSALAGPRSVAGIVAVSAAVEQYVPDGVDDMTATMVLASFGFDIAVTNLGVVDFDVEGPLQPTALWGPALLAQSEGEDVIGVITFNGQLRMIGCSYTSSEKLMIGLQETLMEIAG